MQYHLPLFLIALILQTSVAPPVSQQKKDGDKDKENEVDDMENIGNEYQVEYNRYLREVVQALETDTNFRAKLEKANEDDIRTGKIAHELQFVDHKVRTKLDELKREELERLRHLATKEHNLINGLDLNHLNIADHLDHSNTHTFEIDDLKKLIAKTTKDLADADKRRRQEFKEYEMEKKFDEEQKMKGNTGMKEEERKKYEEELEAMKKKHRDHKPLHHPGSKQQLEEVWEKQDHMEDQEFNPKTFFYLHDVDGNGFWDQDEVKTLFLKELDKLYSEGAPEDDIFERREEMERMREHVFNEADLNHDGLISYQEFLEQTKKPNFQQDEGWQGLDEQQMYSKEEYEVFQKRRQEEIQNMIAKGMLPPPPDSAHLPVHEQFPPQYQQQLQSQQYHPQQIQSSQQYSGQISPQQPIGHVPQQYQGQMPQQQFYQPPPQQPYPGQIPQQHQYQAQQPQYQMPAVPQQQQFQAQPQYQGQPQQAQQQFQSQPQQVQQQSQGQPHQNQQQKQQQMQNQVPQNTQNTENNAPSNNQGVAQPSHNLPENPKSIEQQISQNIVPKVQKV
ncbi:nucleobindin-2 isoform X1 [Camponotus floridanus]|uniref:nucleobindin-2 isoform X1 n=1 Tax=Camponotus floridanus TaxID=104421 RepID=UPI00059E1C32|nr:nucleobindin-2 isoform X1 [Camponotus floridanus]